MASKEPRQRMRAVRSTDAESIAAIYNWYIQNSTCTFEEEALGPESMQARIEQANDSQPWVVLEQDGTILGYAYASIFKARSAYGRTREVTVYLHRDATGRGFGKRLYQYLIDEMHKSPIHSLIASIALPNAGSVALHESLGFEKVGQFSEVGHKFGEFVDVGYWQLRL